MYDGACGPCRAAKSLVAALDWMRRIRAVPLQDPGAARLLAAIPESERWDSFHVVCGGATTSRGAGLIEVLGALPLGGGIPRLAAEAPVLRRVSERAYSLLAAVRGALECAV